MPGRPALPNMLLLIIDGPPVQLALDSEDPRLRQTSAKATTRRYSTTTSRVPGGLQAHCSLRPARLSRPPRSVVSRRVRQLLRELCPHPATSADAAPCLPPKGAEATPRGFPHSLPFVWRGRCPAPPLRAWCGDSRQLATRPRTTHPCRRQEPDSPPFLGAPAHRLPGPYPSGLSRGHRLRGFKHWFTRITLSPCCRARAIRQSPRVASFSGFLARARDGPRSRHLEG
jgi:hypothetical protein